MSSKCLPIFQNIFLRYFLLYLPKTPHFFPEKNKIFRVIADGIAFGERSVKGRKIEEKQITLMSRSSCSNVFLYIISNMNLYNSFK